MFNWLSNLFGNNVSDNPVKVQETKVEEVKKEAPAPKPKATKKSSAKKATVNLDAMSKNDLLAHAKANGIKANASMKKADLIAAIKNG